MYAQDVYDRAERLDAYAVLVAIFAVLWTLDVLTTLLAIGQGWQEGNIGFLGLVGTLGFAGAFVLKFVWGFVLIAFSLLARRYLPRATCWAAAAVCGLMLGIVCWNGAHVLGFLLALR